MDKMVCTNVFWIPDTSWYKPTDIKNSPREYDENKRRRRKIGWLPRRVRKHPKMQRVFGKRKQLKKQKESKPKKERPLKTKGDRFNRLVEQAYKSGKL